MHRSASVGKESLKSFFERSALGQAQKDTRTILQGRIPNSVLTGMLYTGVVDKTPDTEVLEQFNSQMNPDLRVWVDLNRPRSSTGDVTAEERRKTYKARKHPLEKYRPMANKIIHATRHNPSDSTD